MTKFSWKKTPHAMKSPSTLDIAWAAGIWEGEGSIGSTHPGGYSMRVVQKDRWILDRLQLLFGGTVRSHGQTTLQWCVSGARARGFMYTIFSFLSPRRRTQIKAIAYGHNVVEEALPRGL